MCKNNKKLPKKCSRTITSRLTLYSEAEIISCKLTFLDQMFPRVEHFLDGKSEYKSFKKFIDYCLKTLPIDSKMSKSQIDNILMAVRRFGTLLRKNYKIVRKGYYYQNLTSYGVVLGGALSLLYGTHLLNKRLYALVFIVISFIADKTFDRIAESENRLL